MKIFTRYQYPMKFAQIITLLAATAIVLPIKAQDVQASLFHEADRMMGLAKNAQADILSPQAYEDAMEVYMEAVEDYKEEDDLKDIRENLAEAVTNFNKALENVELGQVVFSQTLSARSDAIHSNASSFVKEVWEEAEEEFRKAAEELEEGDVEDAKEHAAEAEQIYRKAELEAIEANYLNNARQLIERAENAKVEKVAPKTLAKAKNLVKQSETALVENRYDTDEARYYAQEAEYQAALAMHIAQKAEEFDEQDYEVEDYMLLAYGYPHQIGQALDLNLRFNEGLETATQEAINKIEALKNQNRVLTAELYEAQRMADNLELQLEEQRKLEQAMLNEMSDEMDQARNRQEQLQARLTRMAEIDEKFDRIQQLFNNQEAQVFRQKNNVIIRLIGLNFDVGQAQIKSEDYQILTKLQQALKIFEDTDITIEGHTDSQGSDATNYELSQERADAVLNYLQANTNINHDHFKTQGFGESKPVGNNETADGRKKNRRIDVVIRPDIDVDLSASN